MARSGGGKMDAVGRNVERTCQQDQKLLRNCCGIYEDVVGYLSSLPGTGRAAGEDR